LCLVITYLGEVLALINLMIFILPESGYGIISRLGTFSVIIYWNMFSADLAVPRTYKTTKSKIYTLLPLFQGYHKLFSSLFTFFLLCVFPNKMFLSLLILCSVRSMLILMLSTMLFIWIREVFSKKISGWFLKIASDYVLSFSVNSIEAYLCAFLGYKFSLK
jgi:hypothetical protein